MFYVEIKNEEEDRSNREITRYTFKEKCYICEKKLSMDGEIEHRIPRCAGGKFVTLNSNLFWACSTCNHVKLGKFYSPSNECRYTEGYCGIIDCTKCDPNEYVGIRIIDELRTEIEVFEKKKAPCNKHTIPLLQEIYCKQGKMDTANLRELKKLIIDSLGPLRMQMSTLFNDYKSDAPVSKIDKDKEDILRYASLVEPFFAIKFTYIEDLCDESRDDGFKEILKYILANLNFHPVLDDCCSHEDSNSD